MNEWLIPFISRLTGMPVDIAWTENIPLILRAAAALAALAVIFVAVMVRYTRGHGELRRFLWWSLGAIAMVIALKYGLFILAKGYIPDRLLFYALPSPKMGRLLFFIGAVAVAAAVVWWSERWQRSRRAVFFLAVIAAYAAFGLLLAGSREGTYSIVERFTRVDWEYTGNVPLVKGNPAQFLHDYTALNPELSRHTSTHPPGYTLFLYFVEQFIGGGYLAMCVVVVLWGGLAALPAYWYVRQKGSDETTARTGVLFLLATPAMALMGAVSMDVVLVPVATAAAACLVSGWRRSWLLSAMGGLAAALALFGNFLVLLLAPLFVYELYAAWRAGLDRRVLVARVAASAAAFAGFFALLYAVTGYSIIENFFVARETQSHEVASNFASLATYLLYVFMNMISLAVGMGISTWVLAVQSRKSLRQLWPLAAPAAGIVAFFTLIGIFQGEVERIWLFILPLWLPFLAGFPALRGPERGKWLVVWLALLFFQSITIGTLFYTYW